MHPALYRDILPLVPLDFVRGRVPFAPQKYMHLKPILRSWSVAFDRFAREKTSNPTQRLHAQLFCIPNDDAVVQLAGLLHCHDSICSSDT
jgi:hypothetical protein